MDASMWDKLYSLLDMAIAQEDFNTAKKIVKIGIKKANETYIDPSFTIRQLLHHDRIIANLQRCK